MLNPLIEQTASRVDTRFLRVLVLPALVLCTALAALLVTGIGWTTTGRWWSARGPGLQVLLGISACVVVLVVANLLSGALPVLLRFCEGYWRTPLGQWIKGRRIEHHRKIWDGSWDSPGDRYLRYPTDRGEVMPTAVGNLLAAAELYPLQRYQIDAVIAWPRLYAVLPEQMRAAVVAARVAMDTAVAMIAVGLLFTAVAMPVAAVTLPGWSVPACLGGGLLVAAFGNRGLVRTAAPYAELVKSSFDLYRGTLLAQLSWKRADSLDGEMNQWEQIMKLWVQGAPQDPSLMGY